MALIPLKIPPGFYNNGTDLDASGRWLDGSLVRWRDGSLRPVKGWRVNENIDNVTNNAVRGMHTWESNNGTRYLAAGSFDELLAFISSGTAYDIAPTDLASGSEDAGVNIGYGYGFYGDGTYGTPRPDTGNIVEATTWSIDNWGEYLVACSTADGRLLEWQLGSSADAAAISNAPTANLGLIVTEERFIFALGAQGNPRKVQWCDQENNTVWSPLATNQAGSLELQTSGQIQTAIRTRGQTLIITDVDAHTARYIGPPYVYGFERVGTSCGIISRKAAADVDMGVFWMGNGGFFRFDGNVVSEIPCDVHDYVFADINTSQKSKTWAWTNGQYGEIWWFYPSSNSTEIDSYVAFDTKENHWLLGRLSRTAGVSRGVFEYPMLANQYGTIYDHEVTTAYNDNDVFFVDDWNPDWIIDGVTNKPLTLRRGSTYRFRLDLADGTANSQNAGNYFMFKTLGGDDYIDGRTTKNSPGVAGSYVEYTIADDAPDQLYYGAYNVGGYESNNVYIKDAIKPFAQSGPISIGNGDNIMHVTDLIPDEKTQGDVEVTFESRFYPNSTATTHGPFTPTDPTSVRFSGRQIRMRVDGDTPYEEWRVGTMRIEAKSGGRR